MLKEALVHREEGVGLIYGQYFVLIFIVPVNDIVNEKKSCSYSI